MPLPSRTAFVTGASRGIGAAVAVALARRGIAPVLAVRHPESAEATRQAVQALGMSAMVVACEVTDCASVRDAVAKCLDGWGGLEDSLWGGPGQLARSNAEQVARIKRILDELGLERTPDEARAMLKLKGADKVGF